jgi:small subunit ribosomal protein S4
LKGSRCNSDKCPINKKLGAPGKDPKARTGKRSEYGLQLREKQKIKRMYGMLEKQFRLTFERALTMPGVTGENLIQLLESRLDNVVYRMHFAACRNQARQIVSHSHILVNGKVVNIPSYNVKPGDVVEVKEKSKKLAVIQQGLENASSYPWVTVDADAVKGTFVQYPRREEVTDLVDVKEQLVVELYSK